MNAWYIGKIRDRDVTSYGCMVVFGHKAARFQHPSAAHLHAHVYKRDKPKMLAGFRNRLIHLPIQAAEAERVHANDTVGHGFEVSLTPVMPSSFLTRQWCVKHTGRVIRTNFLKAGPQS